MSIKNCNLSWYALRVKSNREKLVADCLRCKDYETFLPLYRARTEWSDRIKHLDRPLFPGYLFCRMDILQRLPVLMIPGVSSFVEFGNGPAPMDRDEIRALQTIVESSLPVMPWPHLQSGQRVQIERGPLRGVEGIVADVKGGLRLIVSVALLQRSVAVEISRDLVTPLAASNKRSPTSASYDRESTRARIA